MKNNNTMKTEIKLPKGQPVGETGAQEIKPSGGMCLRSHCRFDVARYFKRDINYSLGLASFIK